MWSSSPSVSPLQFAHDGMDLFQRARRMRLVGHRRPARAWPPARGRRRCRCRCQASGCARCRRGARCSRRARTHVHPTSDAGSVPARSSAPRSTEHSALIGSSLPRMGPLKLTVSARASHSRTSRRGSRPSPWPRPRPDAPCRGGWQGAPDPRSPSATHLRRPLLGGRGIGKGSSKFGGWRSVDVLHGYGKSRASVRAIESSKRLAIGDAY